ncbi:MAG TPA: class I SAM-dependent methyltransferase, partial [Thermoanaerobaculia bacterium]
MTSPSTEAKERFTATRRAHWDFVHRSAARALGGAYHRRLEQVYRIIVLPGLSVLELGCGEGDLLAALAPSRGVGVDFSPAGCAAARRRHPELTILEADASDLSSVDGPL